MAANEDTDWADRSGGQLDFLLVLAGVTLLVLGVAMVAEEYARELENQQALRTFGSTLAFDATHRLKWMPAVTWLVALVSVGAVWRAWGVRRSRRLKRHARKQVILLGAGATLLDVAFYADQTLGMAAAYLVRAGAIAPLYAVAGFLIMGSAWRLRSLIRPLPVRDPERV